MPTPLLTQFPLPALGDPWPSIDGVYAGVITGNDGKPYALVVLNVKPDDTLNWADAMAWAQRLGADLPSRPEAAMLFANVHSHFEKGWHWTSEQYASSFAWVQGFGGGYQRCDGKSSEFLARAVRRFPL